MKEVALSIIIPAYNAEKYVRDCVESVLHSTVHQYELLLIDDGSTDQTGAVCEELAAQDNRIRVFHTPNRGLAEARNFGLDRAKGTCIGFVDADDTVRPRMFEVLLSGMQESVQMSCCKFERCLEGVAPTLQAANKGQRVLNREAAAEALVNGGYGPYAWNKLYRREILERHRIRFPKDCRAIEDVYFLWDYMRHCRKAAFTDEPLYCYIMHHGSIMNSFRENRTVGDQYMNLPRGSRYCAEALAQIAPNLIAGQQARAAMYYQTVLRKLQDPSEQFIREAQDYVRTYNIRLLRHVWGWKYFLSGVLLQISYPLWCAIFRHGMS